MPRARFEPATPATKRPQTYVLDRSATGIGSKINITLTKLHLITIICNICVLECVIYAVSDSLKK
jgi:hypothetical protein